MDHAKHTGIGIDITEVSRFRDMVDDTKIHMLKKIFTDLEITYCDSFKDSATHFAGTFALKEAASKALGVHQFPPISLEVRRGESGAPRVWHDGNILPLLVSISHTATTAVAVAIA